MRTKLTVPFVANPPKPNKGSIVYWDDDPKGFGLAVTVAGFKSFVFNYRYAHKLRRIHFKPGLALSEARKLAKQYQGQVANGRDPLGERKKVEGAEKNTLRAIIDEYFRQSFDLRSADLQRAMLKRHVPTSMGQQQIDEIGRLDITRLIEDVRDTAGPQAARAVFSYLRGVMNWHARRSKFNTPLIPKMLKAMKIKPQKRERMLSDDELRAVWAAAGNGTLFGLYVKFLALTATRRNEAAHMRRSEVNAADWIIPEERYKTGLQLLVPLSKTAAAVLAEIPRLGRSDFVFTVSGKVPMADFSRYKRDFDKACGVHGWTLHDLRRTARSLMSRAGINADHAERCLGHLIGGVRGSYDAYEYAVEKRHAFEALAAQIDLIINPAASNVHQLHRVSQA